MSEPDLGRWADPVVLVEEPDRIVAANSQALELFGVAAEPATDGDVRRLGLRLSVRPMEGGRWPADMSPAERALSGERFHSQACHFDSSSGRLDLLFSGYPLSPGPCGSRRALLTIFDATSFHANHLRNRNLAAQWEAIFESIGSMVFVIEEPARLAAANPAGLQFLGVSNLSEIREKTRAILGSFTLLGPDGEEVPDEEQPLSLARLGQRFGERAFRVRDVSGTWRDLLVSGGPVNPVPGTPRRYLIVTEDVSETRRLQRAKEEFLHVATHELRNPLTVAIGLTALVDRELDGSNLSTLRAHLRLVASELARLDDLIREISDGFRVAEGRLPLQLRHEEFFGMLCDALAPYESTAVERQFVFGPFPAGRVEVSADPRRFGEVLHNLVGNAVKYSPAWSRITVTAEMEDDAVVVRVADEGVGIPPDELESVFEGFTRGTNLGQHDPGGLGLGLYVSRDIIRRHGGELWAENRPGGGTVVCLRFPTRSVAESVNAGPSEQVFPPEAGGRASDTRSANPAAPASERT